MKIQTDSKLIWLWRHPVRSRLVCMRSEVNCCACVSSNCVLTSNEKSQPLTSCIFIVSSEGHTCPGTDLLSISKLFWFGLTWRNCNFAWLTKNSHWAFIDCHTSDFATGGRQDTTLSNWRSIFDPPYRLTRPDFVHHFSPRKPVLWVEMICGIW